MFMEKSKLGKQRLPVIENKIVCPLLLKIAKNPKKSNQIANELGKQQPGIYKQLIKLKEENFVLQNENNEFFLNYEKVVEEFLDYVFSQGEPTFRNFLSDKLDEDNEISPKNNKYLKELLKTSLDYASWGAEDMLDFIGDKESYEMTLNDIFYSIIRVLIRTDLPEEISKFSRYYHNSVLEEFANSLTNNVNQGIKESKSEENIKQDLNMSFEEVKNNKSTSKKFPELFQFSKIIQVIKDLWLDYDENLEEEIKDNILNLLDKENQDN